MSSLDVAYWEERGVISSNRMLMLSAVSDVSSDSIALLLLAAVCVDPAEVDGCSLIVGAVGIEERFQFRTAVLRVIVAGVAEAFGVGAAATSG